MNRQSLRQVAILLRVSLTGLSQRVVRALTTVMGTVAVVAVIVSVLSIAEGYGRVMRTTADPANTMLLMYGANAEIASSIPHEEVAIARHLPGVAIDTAGRSLLSAEPFTTVNLRASHSTHEFNASLRGVEDVGYTLSGARILEGKAPRSGHREVAVGQQLAERAQGLAVGSTVRIGNAPWTVVGRFAAANTLAESEMWAEAGTLAAQIGHGDLVQVVRLRLAPGMTVERFAQEVAQDPRLHLRVVSEQAYLAEQSDSLGGFLRVLGYGIGGMMALGAMFAALGTSYASVSARIREVGTLKALGFRDASVFFAVVAESLLLTVVGGVMGAVGAWLVFDGLQTSTTLYSNNATQVAFSLIVSPWILCQALLFAIAIGVLGSLYPAWKVLRVPITEASAERR